jgi:acetylornithine deacetylase/succinyl-diaminopimelate desuccinylase-like protein
MHVLGVQAHLAASDLPAPATHIKILVEGEEESGSRHFEKLLRSHKAELECDVVVISDTTMWSPKTPTVSTAMRGLVCARIEVHGPTSDIHAGSFGGTVPNPATALARILGDLHDQDGRVAIEGFYDDVRTATDHERLKLAQLPFDEKTWLRNAQSQVAHGESGFDTLERAWFRPTAEVNSMSSGYLGTGYKAVIPAHACADVSFRLVADQDPRAIERLVRAWLFGQLPIGLNCSVEFVGPGCVRVCRPSTIRRWMR